MTTCAVLKAVEFYSFKHQVPKCTMRLIKDPMHYFLVLRLLLNWEVIYAIQLYSLHFQESIPTCGSNLKQKAEQTLSAIRRDLFDG